MTQKPDLLVLSSLRPAQMAELEARYTLHRHDTAEDPEALLAEVGPRIRGVVTTGGRGISGDIVERLPALEVVSTFSVGTDSLDLEACKRCGVTVTNTPDVLNDDVADLALGLMIATRRRMVEADAWVRSGNWAAKGAFPLVRTIKGSRVGILGLGSIGKDIATRCAALRTEIGYLARSEKDVPYAYFDTPRALAEWSDILVAVVPGGSSTRHMVDAEVLKALGPEGTLINVARGSVVDEAALIAALTDGTIAGAGLDVFADEPKADPRFAEMANVVLSPHHASGTEETRNAMAQLVVDNIDAWFGEGRALTPVTG
ncbi:2-hydroxyacid dehydrogenase [Allosediminivita pacifica]|uniref:Lactate dehydrogenase-like 2-hydroxyacid dehydrogenase n=1 Tax=Allosediminivita pacifica TaxID=1267769 RepID=A0A2T6B7K7_9RHOB|nr:2-hydroxyacid dehydrogenase [Allosediminivita pacifica]PTX52071.1 lactate dehydrogenase-like 2-hydroxyacid dehydrogenase [Allosediminivita pacifica]GGA97410.1 D-2-hydroxyacid dehydrogenase [Allosediminivita pacifica]